MAEVVSKEPFKPIVVQAVQRLKMIQADSIGRSADERSQRLEDEVKTLLQAMPANERPAFLAAVAEHFPALPRRDGEAAAFSRPQEPEALVSELDQTLGRLDRARLQVLLTPLLAKYGLLGASSAPSPVGPGASATAFPTAEIGKLLGLSTKPVDAYQCGMLLIELIKVVTTLDDKLVRGLMATLATEVGAAPAGRGAAGESLATLIARLLSSPGGAGLMAEIREQLDRMRRVVGAYTVAGSEPGKFSWQVIGQRLSPDRIRSLAGVNANEKQCWAMFERQYREMSENGPKIINSEARSSLYQFIKGWADRGGAPAGGMAAGARPAGEVTPSGR